MNAKEKKLSKYFSNRLRESESNPFIPYGDFKFFDEPVLARKFANIFGIEPDKNWIEAFRIVTEGQGDEIKKINNPLSSSLLSLLVFHKLFNNESEFHVVIELKDQTGENRNIRFNKCFFEVRNTVITLPSCIDVVLYSEESKIILFLESKFTEYMSVCEQKDYGHGYINLYYNHLQSALSNHIKVENEYNGEKRLLLRSSNDEKIYIEGIKQTISHLIGLVRGPFKGGSGYYPEDYYKQYSKIFNSPDVKMYYGTIIYNPKYADADNVLYDNYVRLYYETIGKHWRTILKEIHAWNGEVGINEYDNKITVLESPITYQSLFEEGKNSLLLDPFVRDCYFYEDSTSI